MSELITLARPYAVAAYERAKETGSADKWADALEFLSAVMADERIAQAAGNPKAKREDFARAFMALCRDHIDGEVENFVRLLIQNHRLALVGQISELFSQYKADDEGYIDAAVTSAFPLTKTEESKLASVLEGLLKKKARLNTAVDSHLIGGVYIRAGDRVIDASVRGQIERMAKTLWN
jgi:F-type H+-transporting ATPase subunit delta